METEKDLQDPPAYSFEDGSPGASDVRTAGSSEGSIHFPEPLIPMPFASNPAWVPSPGEREPITGPPNTSTALVPGPNPIDANGALGDTAKTSRPNSSGSFITFTLSHVSSDNFIVRDSSEQILYWVENRHLHIISANPVHVYKPDPSGQKTQFAEIEFHQWGPSLITLNGKQTDLDNTFVPKSWPSTSRLVKTQYGEWKWTDEFYSPQLFDENRKLLLLYESNQHMFHASTRPTVQIAYKALEHLDMVILGLIVELNDIQRRRRNRNN